MKKLLFLCFFCFCYTYNFSQSKINPDSLAYELQRQKINSMLDARARKFGQYEESLKKHTGIFGWQTRKDIRRSNEILMDINRTDDDIFVQIKVLLSFRMSQQQQAQAKSVQAENYSLAYMNTINRLRDQIDRMKKDAATLKKQHDSAQRIHILIFVLMLGSMLVL
ncbi:MAG: hypothetical protein JST32_06000, partial [Bacteroidetes bacterium]|nr:hypothetical protein [Bacteroidota bacterium]